MIMGILNFNFNPNICVAANECWTYQAILRLPTNWPSNPILTTTIIDRMLAKMLDHFGRVEALSKTFLNLDFSRT